MSKKQSFIEEIDEIIDTIQETTGKSPLSEEAMEYFNALKVVEEKSAKKFTDNGKVVLTFMQNNHEQYNNMFKAKDFESAGISSRTASGALRKLVTDGYCDKLGDKPVIYSLTAEGKLINLDEE